MSHLNSYSTHQLKILQSNYFCKNAPSSARRSNIHLTPLSSSFWSVFPCNVATIPSRCSQCWLCSPPYPCKTSRMWLFLWTGWSSLCPSWPLWMCCNTGGSLAYLAISGGVVATPLAGKERSGKRRVLLWNMRIFTGYSTFLLFLTSESAMLCCFEANIYSPTALRRHYGHCLLRLFCPCRDLLCLAQSFLLPPLGPYQQKLHIIHSHPSRCQRGSRIQSPQRRNLPLLLFWVHFTTRLK